MSRKQEKLVKKFIQYCKDADAKTAHEENLGIFRCGNCGCVEPKAIRRIHLCFKCCKKEIKNFDEAMVRKMRQGL